MVWVAKVKRQSPSVKSELACTAAIVKRGCTVHQWRSGDVVTSYPRTSPLMGCAAMMSCGLKCIWCLVSYLLVVESS